MDKKDQKRIIETSSKRHAKLILEKALNDYPQALEKAQKNLKKVKDSFEETCRQSITNLVKVKFDGWPKLAVSIEHYDRAINVSEVPYRTTIASKTTKINHIKGVILGEMGTGYPKYFIVLTPKGLFSCEKIDTPTFIGPFGGSLPSWNNRQEMSFIAFFGEKPDLSRLNFRAGEYDYELEKQIQDEIYKERKGTRPSFGGLEIKRWRKLRLSGKTAEELDANPDLWREE